MGSIYLPDKLKEKLLNAAQRRGFKVKRGPHSQLSEFLAYLIQLDEQTGNTRATRRTLETAAGLLSKPGKTPPSDEEIENILDQRRMSES